MLSKNPDSMDPAGQRKCEDFEDLLELVGSQGRFQKCFLYGVLGPVSFFAPLFMFNIIFMVYEPDHWCHVPGMDNHTDLVTWKNMTLPQEIGPDGNLRFSQCSMYSGEKIVDCQHGWDYDRQQYRETMVTEYNWVCHQSHYATDALTLASIGNALGTIILGQAADKFGRKPIFFILCFGNIFFRLSSLFTASNFNVFLTHQLIHGLAFPLTYIVSTMLACEVSSKDYRAWVYSFTWLMWILGFSLLPFIAWLTQTWFYMGLATSVPGLLLMLFVWVVPESPRWLVSQGRLSEAKKILEMIAEKNGRTDVLKQNKCDLDAVLDKIFQKNDAQDGLMLCVLKLFTKPILAKNTVMISLMWATNNVVNYGITLSTNLIPGNQFLNFFIVAITEVPAVSVGGYFANKIGRRWTQVLFYFLCAISCVGAACGTWLLKNYYTIMCSAVLVKFAITVTFLVLYIQVIEIFPTQLRSSGSGFASTVGSTMNIMAPYAIFLGKLNHAAPYVVLSGVSVIGAIAAYFLPETLHQKLPESIEEASQLGKSSKAIELTTKENSVHDAATSYPKAL